MASVSQYRYSGSQAEEQQRRLQQRSPQYQNLAALPSYVTR